MFTLLFVFSWPFFSLTVNTFQKYIVGKKKKQNRANFLFQYLASC